MIRWKPVERQEEQSVFPALPGGRPHPLHVQALDLGLQIVQEISIVWGSASQGLPLPLPKEDPVHSFVYDHVFRQSAIATSSVFFFFSDIITIISSWQ